MMRGLVHILVLAAALVYFAYHLLMGERGFTAFARLTCETTEAKATLAGLRLERERLDRNVAHIKNRTDLDLLEERVRDVLYWVGPDDLVLAVQEDHSEEQIETSQGQSC